MHVDSAITPNACPTDLHFGYILFSVRQYSGEAVIPLKLEQE